MKENNPFEHHRMDQSVISQLYHYKAHIVRVKGSRDDVAFHTPTKGCIDKNWQLKSCREVSALYHVKRGGLLGIIPASLGYIVFDVDLDDDLKESSNLTKGIGMIHPQAADRAEKLATFLGKEPKLVIPTYSCGIHAFFRCNDQSLNGYNVPSGHWSVPGGEAPKHDRAYGQFRYRNSQIVIWYGGYALLEMLNKSNKDDPSDWLRKEDIKALRLASGSTKAGGRGQPLFGDITTDQLDTEENWIERVDALQFPEMGRHDYFLTVAGALIMHMAASPKVKSVLERKFRTAIKSRTRRFDPGETARMWKHAANTTKRALYEENRAKFSSDQECKDYVSLRLHPQWTTSKRDRPAYI